MLTDLIKQLRDIGSTQAGILYTESGIAWHPANILLTAANELERLSVYHEMTKSLADEVYRQRMTSDQLYSDMYALSQVVEALTGKHIPMSPGMQAWEEARNVQC